MYRCCVIKSLFKSPASPAPSPFYFTMFKGKMITRSTRVRLMTTGSLPKVRIKNQSIIPPFNAIFKSRRLYSSTVSQKPASLAGASHREELLELLLPGPVTSEKTPLITQSELNKYFYPLFCRGWDIKSLSEAEVEPFRVRDDVRNI